MSTGGHDTSPRRRRHVGSAEPCVRVPAVSAEVELEPSSYYADKVDTLRDLFGTASVAIEGQRLRVEDKTYPIVDDVIVLLEEDQYPEALRRRLDLEGRPSARLRYAEDVQFHYSDFWKEWSEILPYQELEFEQYFDIVDLSTLDGKRVCDLGCGMGRFSAMLSRRCSPRELVLVDFSEAIFTARKLLSESRSALFFMGDILALPFRDGFSDFIMTLGVLHHLPVDCLQVVRDLSRFSPRILAYLYYALDNKPFYYRWLLEAYTPLRRVLYRVRSERFRVAFSWVGLATFYLPFIAAGYAAKPWGLSKYVPLFEEHHWAGIQGMRHSVYDRFFTQIEQRVSRKQIRALEDTFDRVRIAEGQAYWHFLCERGPTRA